MIITSFTTGRSSVFKLVQKTRRANRAVNSDVNVLTNNDL